MSSLEYAVLHMTCDNHRLSLITALAVMSNDALHAVLTAAAIAESPNSEAYQQAKAYQDRVYEFAHALAEPPAVSNEN